MKTCIKCNEAKPETEFYTHAKMADGRLSSCKSCVRRATADRVKEKQNDPIWVAAEAKRCREKAARHRMLGTASPTKPETKRAWQKRNPEKRRAHLAVGHAIRSGKLQRGPCEICGEPKMKRTPQPDLFTTFGGSAKSSAKPLRNSKMRARILAAIAEHPWTLADLVAHLAEGRKETSHIYMRIRQLQNIDLEIRDQGGARWVSKLGAAPSTPRRRRIVQGYIFPAKNGLEFTPHSKEALPVFQTRATLTFYEPA